jgi:chromosome segregation ATPase
MSTAGKVLVVLVALAMVFWLVLAAAITQLNKSWGERIATLDSDISKVKAQIDGLEQTIRKAKDDTASDQAQKARALTVLRSRLSDLEKLETEIHETQERLKFEIASVQSSAKQAQSTHELRKTEVANLKVAQADEEKSVEQLKAENGNLMTELGRLRDQFKSTLDENKRLVDRMRGPRAKPAARVTP